MKAKTSRADEGVARGRRALLRQVEHILEIPMVVLGFLWLALLVWELAAGIGPILEGLGTAIWVIFLIEFAVKFLLAPTKLDFLRRQWLTMLSLALPALRVLRLARAIRVFRLARAARGIRLFRLLTSLNRGLRSLRVIMRRRGFGYVMALATVITFAGAAGMYAFEREQSPGLPSYGAAVWWTAMMMTTVASDYFPQTAEGRVLCLFLAATAFTLWGYLTANLATFFIGQAPASHSRSTNQGEAMIQAELQTLRAALEKIANAPPTSARQSGDATDPPTR
jgi:voltage-gated potassium channel